MNRTLDKQVARLLGDQPIEINNPVTGAKTAWRDAQGHAHFTSDGGPPFYSAHGEYGTAPLILAEINQRKLRAKYCEALIRIFDPGEAYSLDGDAIEANHPAANMAGLVWALLTASPEQHCRAFVEVCSDAAAT